MNDERDEGRGPTAGDYRHLELLAWATALVVFIGGVLLIGFAFVWLMGVIR